MARLSITCLVALALITSATVGVCSIRYVSVVLEAPEGCVQSWANDINDAGQIAGGIQMAGNTIDMRKACMWNNGHIVLLPSIAKAPSNALGINNPGQIAGSIADMPYVWDTSGAHRLPIAGAYYGTAADINDNGVVVGGLQRSIANACIWDTNGITELPRPQYATGAAAAHLNNNRVVIGNYYAGWSGSCYWDNNEVHKLSNPFRGPTGAKDINDAGVIVGYCFDGNIYAYPCKWDTASPQVLPLLPGTTRGYAEAINNSGLIAGRCDWPDKAGWMCIWDESGVHAIAPSPWADSGTVTAMNNKGIIVGYRSKDNQACMWIPYAEVSIDIKPGESPNSINLRSNGVTPAAILSDAEFDATQVAPDTVTLANAKAIRWHLADVDGDGDADLMLHFKTSELKSLSNATEATLTGRTTDGRYITGSDSVKIVL